MNEAMNIENIRDHFATIEKSIDNNVVYGYIEPKN